MSDRGVASERASCRHRARFLELMMITWRHSRIAAVLLSALTLAAGCDGGDASRTPDEFAADSALAADLALANRDTLLVDSIGAYRPSGGADSVNAADTAVESSADSPAVRSAVPSAPAAAKAAAPAPAPRPSSTSPSSATPPLTGTRACSSPTLENQNECVRVTLASTDARLNRIYRALITEMRRQEGVRGGAKDPPSVQRLRVSQRAWLVYRDTECRRRGRGREGALWARPRVRCLGQFSNRRARELADNFSRLTSH